MSGTVALPKTAAVLRSQVAAALDAWQDSGGEGDPADAVMRVLEPIMGHIRECWNGEQVTVRSDDLRAVLAVAYDLAGRSPQFGRLAEAAGVVRRDA